MSKKIISPSYNKIKKLKLKLKFEHYKIPFFKKKMWILITY